VSRIEGRGWVSRIEGRGSRIGGGPEVEGDEVIEAANGGWLTLLAAVLALWQPVSFAFTASAALPSLAFRGWLDVGELAAAGVIAAVSATASWALWSRALHGVPLARLALILSAVRGVQSLYWTRLPSDVVPGTEGIFATLIVAHTVAWLVYLSRSRRVRALR
jgi:hypothetical protein